MNFVNTCSYSFLFLIQKQRAILSAKPKSERTGKRMETYIKNIFSQIKEKNNTMIRSLEFDEKYYQIS